ncbi:hypothetical protein BJ742DRAFT_800769 [Cladochytrium replicatum]|nr:hypothetical protein BJ742DRAFT_800769 [Cladochytrium replicatum]
MGTATITETDVFAAGKSSVAVGGSEHMMSDLLDEDRAWIQAQLIRPMTHSNPLFQPSLKSLLALINPKATISVHSDIPFSIEHFQLSSIRSTWILQRMDGNTYRMDSARTELVLEMNLHYLTAIYLIEHCGRFGIVRTVDGLDAYYTRREAGLRKQFALEPR